MHHYDYIAIEGNIGAGKTTLSRMISEQFNARLILEQFEDNPFLPKFYKLPEKYAFPLELSFLASRYQQLQKELGAPDLFSDFTIADYFIDKSYIFARQTIKGDELNLYSRLFYIISSNLPRPDLLVFLYLDIPHLKDNITMRGRSYEQNIQSSYLEAIQSGYFDYFKQISEIPILIIDTNDMDFVKKESDYEYLLDIIFQEHSPGIHRFTK